MIIIRGAADGEPVVVIRRAAAQDGRLSLRARGIIADVLSRPPGWRTDAKTMATQTVEGEHAIRAAMNELVRFDYLVRERIRDNRGRVRTVATITDNPERITGTRLPRAGGPRAGGPRAGGPRAEPPPPGQPPAGPPRLDLPPSDLPPPSGPPDDSPPTGLPSAIEEGELGGELGGEVDLEDEGDAPPPRPGRVEEIATAVGGLLVVVVDELQRTATPKPGRRPLTNECRRLMHLGWSPDQLRTAVRTHDWSGARAGAVIAWLRDLAEPPAPTAVPRPRPEWCGDCDQASRLLLDDEQRPRRGHPCPTCNPTLVEA